MAQRLDVWYELVEATNLALMKRFASMLNRHGTGICNYADHPIIIARLESGDAAVRLIRKWARGLLDTEHLKLKMRQTATEEEPLGFYVARCKLAVPLQKSYRRLTG